VGDIYHLSPDKSIKVREVVRLIADCMGTTLREVSEDTVDRLGQDAIYEIDSSKARSEIGWKPETSLEHGVREVVQWVNKNWDEIKEMPHEYIHKP